MSSPSAQSYNQCLGQKEIIWTGVLRYATDNHWPFHFKWLKEKKNVARKRGGNTALEGDSQWLVSWMGIFTIFEIRKFIVSVCVAGIYVCYFHLPCNHWLTNFCMKSRCRCYTDSPTFETWILCNKFTSSAMERNDDLTDIYSKWQSRFNSSIRKLFCFLGSFFKRNFGLGTSIKKKRDLKRSIFFY